MAEYAPCWFYHKDGRSRIVESAEDEAALMHEGGWANTPAAHGVISAPSVEQLAKMPRIDMASVPGTGSSPAEQMAFSHLLLQWQNKLDAAEKHAKEMEQEVAGLHRLIQVQQQEGKGFEDRIHALEQAVVQRVHATSPVTTDPAHPVTPASRRK